MRREGDEGEEWGGGGKEEREGREEGEEVRERGRRRKKGEGKEEGEGSETKCILHICGVISYITLMPCSL